jgi:Flp pilus assembly protein TadD
LEAQKIAPDHLPLLDALGILAEHEGRLTDAEAYYAKTLAIQPHYSTAVSNLTRLYYQNGFFQKSADLAWQEYQYNPTEDMMVVYAMSLIRLKRYDDAIAVMTKYYGDNPANINMQFALGVAYWKKGDKTGADVYFKESKNPQLSDKEFIDLVNGL